MTPKALVLLTVFAGACCAYQGQDGLVPKGDLSILTGHALIATDDGIVAISPDGKTKTRLTTTMPGWCAVDDRAMVLWFLEAVELKALDLARPGRIVTVATLPESVDDVWLTYGKEALPEPEPHTFEAGLQIAPLEQKPLSVLKGCDGDMMVYCLGDGENEEESAEIEERWQALDKLTFQAPAFLAEIRQRAKDRRLSAPNTIGERVKKVEVPTAACETDEESCGDAFSLGATGLQLVVVGNSGEDFTYHWVNLYDPQRRLFIHPTSAGRTRATPSHEEDWQVRAVWISDDGKSKIINGAFFVGRKGPVFSGERACGITGGATTIRF